MNEQPLISVVLATYNGSKYLTDQLESIYNQSYKNIEVIVCDDKSSDDTEIILKTYKERHNLKYYINEDRLGVINNFAKVISYCNGDYVALSDQDDVWLPHKLEVSLKKIQDLAEIDSPNIPLLVYSDLKVVDENLNCISASYWKFMKLNQRNIRLNKLLVENLMTGCTALMNRATIDLAFPIPKEALMHDAWILLVSFCFGKVSYLEEQTVLYRQHSNNVIGSIHKSKIRKIDLAINKIRNKNFSLLDDEINQAKAFYYKYFDLLSNKEKERRTLDSFIHLKEQGLLGKKLSIIKHSFYGSTFVRFANILLRA